MVVNNSTFTDNSSSWASGGICNYSDGNVIVTNSTFANNSASEGEGGGIGGDNLTLNNTIVATNTGGDISGQVNSSSSNNLIGNGTGITDFPLNSSNLVGTTTNPINPMLGPIQNNGGPTETMALLPGSPAICAGSVNLAVDANRDPLQYDQRGPGYPRTTNGTVDIGAYEFSPLSQTISLPPISTQVYGVAPITLTATSSSNLPVTYIVVSGPATISGSFLTITGAGLVDVEADQVGNATYAPATPVDDSFSVTPALLTVTPTYATMPYGGPLPTLTASYSGFVNGDTVASLTTPATVTTTATASSHWRLNGYPTTASGASDPNYTISYQPGTLLVLPTPLTITANNSTSVYGTSPILTASYTGFVNGDTAASLTVPLTLSTTATSSSPVGTYQIVALGAQDMDYTITYANPGGSSTWSSIGTLTVIAAPLTVSATNESMTYGGTVPTPLTYTYTGLVNGGTVPTFSGSLSTTATSSSNVGDYPVTQGTLAATGNYTIGTYVPGTLTVIAAPLTVSATNESMTYGGTVPTPLTYTYTGLVNGGTVPTFSGSLSTTATSSSNVGDYPVTQGTLAATGNYTISTYDPGTLTVIAAPLTVTATNESMMYGGTVPVLGFAYTGVVNGGTSPTFSGSLVATATSSSNVGAYPITQGTLKAIGNYTIYTFNPGALTVTPAPLTVTATSKSMVYGSPVPTLTYAYTGLVNKDASATFTGSLVTTATSSSNVGAYPITQGTLKAIGNYTINTFNPGALTVTPAPLTVTATSKSMVYGSPVPVLTYAYTGLVNKDASATFTGSLVTTATSSSNVGAYPITCTFPENTEPAATGQGIVSADFSAPTGERPSRARRGSPR